MQVVHAVGDVIGHLPAPQTVIPQVLHHLRRVRLRAGLGAQDSCWDTITVAPLGVHEPGLHSVEW